MCHYEFLSHSIKFGFSHEQAHEQVSKIQSSLPDQITGFYGTAEFTFSGCYISGMFVPDLDKCVSFYNWVKIQIISQLFVMKFWQEWNFDKNEISLVLQWPMI